MVDLLFWTVQKRARMLAQVNMALCPTGSSLVQLQIDIIMYYAIQTIKLFFTYATCVINYTKKKKKVGEKKYQDHFCHLRMLNRLVYSLKSTFERSLYNYC